MHYEIEFFCNKLKPDSGIEWETPIAHLIPWMLFAMTIGDSLLEGTGFLHRLGILVAPLFPGWSGSAYITIQDQQRQWHAHVDQRYWIFNGDK